MKKLLVRLGDGLFEIMLWFRDSEYRHHSLLQEIEGLKYKIAYLEREYPADIGYLPKEDECNHRKGLEELAYTRAQLRRLEQKEKRYQEKNGKSSDPVAARSQVRKLNKNKVAK